VSGEERSGTLEGAGLPAAGWYPDSTNPGHERLWTGERWIAWIRPNRVGGPEADPAGWRPDAGHPGFERLWAGEMWTEEIRRVGEAGAGAPLAATPEAAAPATAAAAGVAAVPGAPALVGAAAGGPPDYGAPASAAPFATAPPFATAGPGLALPPTAPSAGAIYHDGAPPDKLGALGTWVRAAFALLIVANLAELIANWRYIDTENDIVHGPLPTYGHYVSSVNAVRTTNLIVLLMMGACSIFFVIWFYRAYRNIVRAGMGDLRFSPGWAIGGWFIPIFSYFRQKQIANDIWKASEGVATVGPAARHTVRLPSTLNWWWGLWIFSGLITGIGNLTITHVRKDQVVSVTGLHDTRTGLWLDQIGLLVGIVALVLVIGLVRQISQRQDAHFRAPAESWPAR
jgi:hypothetical protein